MIREAPTAPNHEQEEEEEEEGDGDVEDEYHEDGMEER